jgi:hypothetical protein
MSCSMMNSTKKYAVYWMCPIIDLEHSFCELLGFAISFYIWIYDVQQYLACSNSVSQQFQVSTVLVFIHTENISVKISLIFLSHGLVHSCLSDTYFHKWYSVAQPVFHPLGVKLLVCEADQLPPTTKVKKVWSYTSTLPCVFVAFCLIK